MAMGVIGIRGKSGTSTVVYSKTVSDSSQLFLKLFVSSSPMVCEWAKASKTRYKTVLALCT